MILAACFAYKIGLKITMFLYVLQVHHGGAGTTAAGLKAAVIALSFKCFCSFALSGMLIPHSLLLLLVNCYLSDL